MLTWHLSDREAPAASWAVPPGDAAPAVPDPAAIFDRPGKCGRKATTSRATLEAIIAGHRTTRAVIEATGLDRGKVHQGLQTLVRAGRIRSTGTSGRAGEWRLA